MSARADFKRLWAFATAYQDLWERALAADVLVALRENTKLGYPTLSRELDSLMRAESEDRSDLWEHHIEHDHPLHRYTLRTPDGVLSTMRLSTCREVIALGTVVLSEQQRACVMAEALATFEVTP